MPESEAERRFQSLYAAYGEDVFLYFKRRNDDPADCTAETFLVAWRRLGEIPEGDRALAWLYGVAHFVLLNQRRSARRARRLVERVGGLAQRHQPGPDTITVRRSEEAALLEALARLNEGDQELLRLAAWEELPYDDIGRILGCSRHAVDQRIYRAKKRLARELRHSGHLHAAPSTPPTQPEGRAS